MITLPRTAHVLEQVRLLAMFRLAEGWTQQEVAEFLDISTRSVRRWRRRFRDEGEAGLAPQPGRGRPTKLTAGQVEQILAWLDRSACAFGFPTERWTAPRVALLVAQTFDVHLHPRYLSDWLRRHGVTPQMPQRQPRERDEALIEAWVAHQWPRIKKRSATCTERSALPTRAASCSRR